MIIVDPGASGAITTIQGEEVTVHNMPDGMSEQIDLIRSLRADGHLKALIERVGGYMPGNSGPAAATFARHCGHIEAACYCLGLGIEYVSPQVWQRGIGTFSKDKPERKKQIKEMMARRFPALKVTLKNADALGMLVWYQNK